MTMKKYMMMKKKMEIEGYDNFNEYARKKAMCGWIIVEDFNMFLPIQKMLEELGEEINKIAMRADRIEVQEERIKHGEISEKKEPPISLDEIKIIDRGMEKIANELVKINKAYKR